MNKFISPGKWLTLDEAAKLLSNYFGEEKSRADVFRLALDGKLKLSVEILCPAKARLTKVVGWEETEWVMFPRMMNKNPLAPELTLGNAKCPPFLEALWKEIPEDEREMFFPVLPGIKLNDEQFLFCEDRYVEIEGIFDLPMIGDERLDVQHEYHLLTGGPIISLEPIGDVYVEDENGEIGILQLQIKRNIPEKITVQEIYLRKLKTHISNKKIKRPEAQILLAEHHNKYKDEYSWERANELNQPYPAVTRMDDYEPATSLPEDSVFVVRNAALLEHERSNIEARSSPETGRPIEIAPKPRKHSHSAPELQRKANAIAADLTNQDPLKRIPTRGKVAKILAKELGMGCTTVERRLVKEWSSKR